MFLKLTLSENNIPTLNYRMNSNTALNVTCDFNDYLVCQMPADTVQMELKIKIKRGKYALHKDTSTRTERYHPWERADKQSKFHTKRTREVKSETSNSETGVQMGKGFAHPPEIFTNPEFTKTIPLTDTDSEEVEVTNPNFIGEFCSECIKKYNRCWCFKSDWKDNLIEVETPRVLTTKTKINNSQQLTVTVMPKRQPPPGWAEFRRHVTKKNDNDSIDKLIIKGMRSISMQEFEEM